MHNAKFFALTLLPLAAAGCTTMDGSASADTSARSSAAPKEKVTVAKVGGAAMYSNRTIVENAVNSPVHKTLVKLITSAGLVDTLNSAGPFTVFAPTDKAFAAVPKNVTSFLTNPANKATLIKVLTYHVVPGRVSFADLMGKIKAGGGTTVLTTVEGEQLTFTRVNSSIKIDGMSGSTGYITTPDVMQSNGIIHVVNGVLVPTL